MIKKIKKHIMSFVNHNLTYDKAEKLLYLVPKYKKKVVSNIIKYETALRKIEKRIQTDKITIVFVCQVPSLWNGVRSIFEAARNHPDVIAHIVAIPEKRFGDNKCKEYGKNIAYDFCREFFNETINGYDQETKEFLDLSKLNPTYVFLPRPYDYYLPPKYRSYSINEYAKVCYIPYGYDMTIWDSRYSYEKDFICNVYAVFAENKYYQEMLLKIFKIYSCADTKKVFNMGYPRFDLYKECTHIHDEKYRKVILWLPRWTTDSKVQSTTFFLYKDILINYFREHQELKLICRPHPLMIRNFVADNLMTEEEARDFLNTFEVNSNFEYDSNGDYIDSFRRADIFISDYTSLLVEELLMNVPIIYTGQTNGFEKISLKLISGMYKVRKEVELLQILEDLISEKDVLKEYRWKIQEILKVDDFSIGKNIVEILLKEYREIHEK